MKKSERGIGKHKWSKSILVLFVLLLTGPISILVNGDLNLDTHWSDASNVSSGQAPTPDDEPAAMVQVYGARAYN